MRGLGRQKEEVTTSFNPLWFRLQSARKWLTDELEQLRTDRCSVGERRESSPCAKADGQATETSELERRRALEKRLRDQLAEIEHALHKKDQGTYGLCDFCGRSIEPARLEALPQANLCLGCKARQVKNATGSRPAR